MSKVILRPLKTNTWAGVIRYRNCHEDLGSYFTRSGRLYTGLTSEEEKELGKKLGYDLSPSSDFWKTFYIRCGSEDLILDLNDDFDRLKYLFLKNHKRVASSLSEKKASASYVLVNRDEEAKEANKKNRTLRKAMKELDKLSAVEMRKVLRLYGIKSDTISAEVAETRLNDEVMSNPKKFFDLWVDNTSRETEYLIKEAVANNIIRKNKNVYKYGNDVIGHSLEDTVDYIDDANNQEIKTAIIKQLEVKS